MINGIENSEIGSNMRRWLLITHENHTVTAHEEHVHSSFGDLLYQNTFEDAIILCQKAMAHVYAPLGGRRILFQVY